MVNLTPFSVPNYPPSSLNNHRKRTHVCDSPKHCIHWCLPLNFKFVDRVERNAIYLFFAVQSSWNEHCDLSIWIGITTIRYWSTQQSNTSIINTGSLGWYSKIYEGKSRRRAIECKFDIGYLDARSGCESRSKLYATLLYSSYRCTTKWMRENLFGARINQSDE